MPSARGSLTSTCTPRCSAAARSAASSTAGRSAGAAGPKPTDPATGRSGALGGALSRPVGPVRAYHRAMARYRFEFAQMGCPCELVLDADDERVAEDAA